MYIAKLPFDTNNVFEVIETEDLKKELFDKFKKETPDATENHLNELVKQHIDKLFEDGYKEFIFSKQPETREGEIAVISFEDIGGKIYQKWDVVIDVDHYNNLIISKKNELSNTDYKVIKCYEAFMCGEDFPYDINGLRIVRQRLRNEINRIEEYNK